MVYGAETWAVMKAQEKKLDVAEMKRMSEVNNVERGSSVVECRTRNQVSPGSNPSLLPFRRLGIFVLSIDALSWCRNEQVCQGRQRV